MKLNSLVKVALLGLAMMGAIAAHAATPAAVDPAQADWTTTLKVKLALLDKLGTDTLHIEVNSAAGTVSLTGTVEKRESMKLASKVTKSVRGVRRVESALRLQSAVDNPSKAAAAAGESEAEVKDAVLDTKLRLALIEKMGSDGYNIGTDAANGVVTLSFDHAVDSDSRQRAAAIAQAVAGVSKVVSLDKT